MRPIFLIGMMGAGKTHWSRVWGEEQQAVVIDLDELIERQESAAIQEIFAQQGEAVFRMIEQRALHEAIAMAQMSGSEKAAIIACGGGTPLFFDNMQRMKAAGCVVYLEASVEELLHNLAWQTAGRPMLTGNPEGSLTTLLLQRRQVYEQADHIVPIKNITPTTFAKILNECTNRHS